MAGEHDGHALLGQPADQQPHVAHAGRIEPGGRLVEQQQLGVAQQCGGDPQALAHAVRVAADPVLGPARSARPCPGPRRSGPGPRSRRRRRASRDCAARSDTDRRSGPRRTRPRRQAPTRCPSGSRPNTRTVPSVGLISPSIIRSEVVLPAPLGPEVAVHVAGADGDVHPGDGGQLAVALDQPADLERATRRWTRGRRRGRPRARRAVTHSARAAFSAATGGTEPSTV